MTEYIYFKLVLGFRLETTLRYAINIILVLNLEKSK